MELFKNYFVNVLTKKYIAFDGTAKRPEFWYFILFTFIISFVLGIVFFPLAMLFNLVIVLPSLALGARRLRDAGLSPWLVLLNILFGIGTIIFLILCALPSKK